MSTRDAGFYWVKHRGRWIVAEWVPGDGRGWWHRGDDRSYLDRDWDEIGPRIEPPPHDAGLRAENLWRALDLYGRHKFQCEQDLVASAARGEAGACTCGLAHAKNQPETWSRPQ